MNSPRDAASMPADAPPEAGTATAATVLALEDAGYAADGHRIVEHANLEVRAGEVLCLLGPSGCGKTSLLRTVAGLQPLSEGRILIDGRCVAEAGGAHQPPEHRRVGLAFQEPALFPHLRVLDNVTFGLKGTSEKERRQRALHLLELFGMSEWAQAYPHTLSGGQQQRVALARALAPSPKIMLLDEPFASLDARLRDQIRDDTLHVLKRLGAATMLVTHDPEEAMFMADRIALMRNGRIVQTGTPRQLFREPREPFVVSFFGAANEWQGEVRNGWVETPVEPVAAGNLAEGTPVQVMVRPEAIQVTPLPEQPGETDSSHVLMARFLGRGSMLHICAHGSGDQEAHVHARVPGLFLPQEEQPVSLSLDHDQTFVFPLPQDPPQ